MKFQEEYKDYLIDDQEKSQNTINQYMREIKAYEEWLTETEKAELMTTTKAQIDKYIRFCRDEKGNKPLTLNTKIAAIRSILGFYVIKGLIEYNPASDVKSKKVVREEPVYLTEEECHKLLSAIINDNRRGVNKLDRIRDYAIFRIFLAVGLRSSELANLTVDDIDFRTNKIKVRKAKGNKTRTLILSEGVMSDISQYLEIREKFNPTTDNLFIARGGGGYTPVTMGRKVKAYCELAGLDAEKIHTHTLRHTAATLTYANSNDLVGTGKMLGHNDIRTTQIYAHMMDEKLQKTMLSNPLSN